jgi:hypothetical protein
VVVFLRAIEEFVLAEILEQYRADLLECCEVRWLEGDEIWDQTVDYVYVDMIEETDDEVGGLVENFIPIDHDVDELDDDEELDVGDGVDGRFVIPHNLAVIFAGMPVVDAIDPLPAHAILPVPVPAHADFDALPAHVHPFDPASELFDYDYESDDDVTHSDDSAGGYLSSSSIEY